MSDWELLLGYEAIVFGCVVLYERFSCHSLHDSGHHHT